MRKGKTSSKAEAEVESNTTVNPPDRFGFRVIPEERQVEITDQKTGRVAHVRMQAYEDVRSALISLFSESEPSNGRVNAAPKTLRIPDDLEEAVTIDDLDLKLVFNPESGFWLYEARSGKQSIGQIVRQEERKWVLNTEFQSKPTIHKNWQGAFARLKVASREKT
jgi:hypothetical protein